MNDSITATTGAHGRPTGMCYLRGAMRRLASCLPWAAFLLACGARTNLDGAGTGGAPSPGGTCSAGGTVREVSVGGSSCALTTGGSVACWGNDRYGTIGDGSNVNAYVPVEVPGWAGASALSAGTLLTCTAASGVDVGCWGELGFDPSVSPTPPSLVRVPGEGVTSVSVGGDHGCVLTRSGGVKCWGKNDRGALGDGLSESSSAMPVDVRGLASGVSAISAGAGHTCALTSAGGVQCWGSNGSGELGDQTRTDRSAPVDVVGLTSGVAAIAAGGGFSCALMVTGGVRCWGTLGSQALLSSTVPVDVAGLARIASISAGSGHACGVTVDGGAKCWGSNVYGKLGDGSEDDPTVGSPGPLTAVDVKGLDRGVSNISAGQQQTCAVLTSCHVMCWGENFSGELGNDDPSVTHSTVPVQVTNL
jgi:alpha-tubulin suppressor-like RCC1 family protein